MGVWGLLSFVQMHNPPLGQSHSFHSTSTGSASTDQPRAVVIVDGNALGYHLFQRCGECCWWDGGELRDFGESVREWVREMQGTGLRLRVVMDGMMEPMKENTAIQRGKENAAKVHGTLSKIRACKGSYGSMGVGGFVLPWGAIEVMVEAFVAEGVPTRRAMYEADSELARECVQHAALGVLSNDSDFVCMRVPLLPLNELRLGHGAVELVRYAPEAVAGCLGVGEEQLPLLACMCGNDYIDKALLDNLHQE
eukprot:CAMPEP_0169458058 /NCGR_PEP_ID=MMETSP1042-20121227/17229_1 /TAXON_ID=464988 /ORGANISM="Hemiselmis andersenii, Strain CCMP1180" /LENGTH=251 /DNA_ID=CAMNT_0009570413 /DNA_START=123 /DNA_END=875 /DNA_ORIENTATION=-